LNLLAKLCQLFSPGFYAKQADEKHHGSSD
jgi:hypothetical protein